jgi:hypothetical protein
MDLQEQTLKVLLKYSAKGFASSTAALKKLHQHQLT